jgi:DNA-binding IclR family transcriptional regulator
MGAKLVSRGETGAGAPAVARPRYEARILGRALSILDRFADGDEWGFMELCQATGLHKSTAFRIVSSLETAAYLEKRPATGRYRPGPKLRRLEAVLLRAAPLRWTALAPLQDLARRTEETAHIGILYQGESVTVEIAEGTHAVRMHSAIGKRAPAHASALGKALLAHAADAEIDELVARFGLRALTPRTITDPARLKAHLREARRRGFAVDDEELEPGLRCVSAPIPEPVERPFAAVSISGPAWRLSPARDEDTARALQETAQEIAALLGRLGPGPWRNVTTLEQGGTDR